MSRFEHVSSELRQLQADLQEIADRLRALQAELETAYSQGHSEKDFLPRRLHRLRFEAQAGFERLTDRLNLVVHSGFQTPFLPLSSPNDLKTVQGIRRTIRYIRNAFAHERSLGETLVKLQNLPTSL